MRKGQEKIIEKARGILPESIVTFLSREDLGLTVAEIEWIFFAFRRNYDTQKRNEDSLVDEIKYSLNIYNKKADFDFYSGAGYIFSQLMRGLHLDREKRRKMAEVPYHIDAEDPDHGRFLSISYILLTITGYSDDTVSLIMNDFITNENKSLDINNLRTFTEVRFLSEPIKEFLIKDLEERKRESFLWQNSHKEHLYPNVIRVDKKDAFRIEKALEGETNIANFELVESDSQAWLKVNLDTDLSVEKIRESLGFENASAREERFFYEEQKLKRFAESLADIQTGKATVEQRSDGIFLNMTSLLSGLHLLSIKKSFSRPLLINSRPLLTNTETLMRESITSMRVTSMSLLDVVLQLNLSYFL